MLVHFKNCGVVRKCLGCVLIMPGLTDLEVLCVTLMRCIPMTAVMSLEGESVTIWSTVVSWKGLYDTASLISLKRIVLSIRAVEKYQVFSRNTRFYTSLLSRPVGHKVAFRFFPPRVFGHVLW